jgi:hypothetical protein
VGKAQVELPDGRKAVIEYETQAQLDAAIKDLAQPKGGVWTGWGEAALQVGTSAISTPAAGVAGLAVAGARGLGLTNAEPADAVRNVQSAFTYQPRTRDGETASRIVSYPFEKLAQGADWLGQRVLNTTDSPALATATNVGVQFAPALFIPRKPKGQPGVTPQQAAEANAREFVSRSVGMDWDTLPVQVKERLTQVAGNARNLDALDPAAIRRQAELQSLPVPVPATRGQIARDPVQLRNEANVAGTTQGAPIRDVYDAQNRALVQNLDILAGRTRGKSRTMEDAGRAVQDSGLRAKAQLSKKRYNDLYAQARQTEPNAQVSAQPLYQLIEGSPEITRLGFVESWLNKAKVTKTERAPDGTVVQTQRGVTLRELDDLRKRSVAIARSGGTDAVYAGDVIRAIDASMEQVPAAAKSWREAINAYKQHKREFSDQGAVADLVENYPNSADRRVALEGTVNRIANGSLENIRTIKRSLLVSDNPAVRTAGREAWRDIRKQLIEQIKDEATRNSATLADGSPNLSVAGLKRSIDRIGPEKMVEIFGAPTANKINSILRAAQNVKTIPAQSVPVGSTTVQNVLALMGEGVDKIPLVGDLARGVAQVRNIGANAREASAAVQNPLAEAAARSQNALATQQAGRNALAVAPATVPREQRPR